MRPAVRPALLASPAREMASPAGAATLKWRKPHTEGKRVSARGGHSASVVGSDLVLFGGHVYGGGGKFEYYNDTSVLDLESNTWHVVKTGGSKPGPRYGHSASVVGSKIYVFGGKGPDGRMYNDVHFLDTLSWCWVELSSTTSPPPARFGHATCVVGDKLVVFGGWDGAELAAPDLWVFDTTTCTWVQPKVNGRPPLARQGHVMELTRDGRVVVFGGMTLDPGSGHPSYLSDVRSLDIETMVWSAPRTGGVRVEPRFLATSCMMGKYMVVFGGWIQRQNAHLHKAPVSGGAGVRVKEPTTADTIIAYDTEELEWVLPLFFGTCPDELYGHSLALAGGQVILYGGWGGNRALDELFVGEPLGMLAVGGADSADGAERKEDLY